MLAQRIADFIEREQLFTPDDRLLLAVSGGMDSMVMWRVLHELGYTIAVAHCNFQLRGNESDADQTFVQEQAAVHSTPFFSERFETEQLAALGGCSIQEMARILRYDYFEQLLEEEAFDYVLTAHHLDDRLETFWLNFSRGAGLDGLASLKPKNGIVRRPILSVNREEIRAYQASTKVPFREDSSNASDKYRRNYFRHHILPQLYEWSPSLDKVMQRNFELLEQQAVLLEEQLDAYRQQLFSVRAEHTYEFKFGQINNHPARQAITTALLQRFGFDKEQCRQILVASTGTMLQSEKYEALVQSDHALIRPLVSKYITANEVMWHSPQHPCSFDFEVLITYHEKAVPQRIPADPRQAWVDTEQLVWPLQIRYWQAADRFCPLGMNGQSQKLQDFFVNQKIDRYERDNTPLLVNGDGRIIWIVGHRLDDRFKLTAATQSAACFVAEPTNAAS